MTIKEKEKITNHMKKIWYDICILEHDYGIEYEGYMTQILKFTMQCIANKYGINLGLSEKK